MFAEMPLESFRGFNFRGIGPFCSMHACNIKFRGFNVRGSC